MEIPRDLEKESLVKTFKRFRFFLIIVLSAGCLNVALHIDLLSPVSAQLEPGKLKDAPRNTAFGTVNNRFRIHGEMMLTKESSYLDASDHRRPGLEFISKINPYIPRVVAHYSSPLKKSFSIREKWEENLYWRKLSKHPWKLASEWATPHSLIASKPYGLGNIINSLKKSPITQSDVGYKGTQLKLTLVLKGKQKAVFKPKWYDVSQISAGEVHGGKDRYNGEIVSFYLGCLIGLRNIPITTARKVSLQNSISPVASKKLAATFLKNGSDTCVYGVCYYCHHNDYVCDANGFIEGAITLWLPDDLPFLHKLHPWSRKYKKSSPAKWESDSKFCSTLPESKDRILDLVELSVFDFLIQNGDRHHFTVIKNVTNSSVIAMDNGKSFGDPYTDHIDILAPLIQCCIIRKKLYENLVAFSGGGLSKALKELLASEIVLLLDDPHYKAIDRRLTFVLSTIVACKKLRKEPVVI